MKACIAKQLENQVERDNLVWKATASCNFFPKESSGIAPFFLLFGWEANMKYFGTDDSMINMEFMTKLYLVVAHNLNKARKASDGGKIRKNSATPDILKIGDNVLVKNHTFKVF